MATHFHPSVANFAGCILDGSGVKYSGDPIQDFTIMRFLDRFVFRNPKKDTGDSKSSSIFNKRNQYKAKGVKSLAPDSKYVDIYSILVLSYPFSMYFSILTICNLHFLGNI